MHRGGRGRFFPKVFQSAQDTEEADIPSKNRVEIVLLGAEPWQHNPARCSPAELPAAGMELFATGPWWEEGGGGSPQQQP